MPNLIKTTLPALGLIKLPDEDEKFKKIFLTGRDNWRDLVYQQVKDDPGLQFNLFRFLTEDKVTTSDIDEAIYWFRKLDYPR
jgi:hypothetical protein